MIFPEQLTDMCINAPKEHQRIISKLTTGLGQLYYHDKKISLEPLPETMLDEGQTSPVPDVILYDNHQHITPIIIEVCHSSGVRNDIKKLIKLIDDYDYGIQEGFLYDYSDKRWFCYRKDQQPLEENRSFSAILNLDLNRFL
ncbi:MAG: hypothetical protein ACLFT3_20710 [Cyclobacteriaceae bacterium]